MQASGALHEGRWTGLREGKLEFQQPDKPLDAIAIEDVMWLKLQGSHSKPPRDAPHAVTLVDGGSAAGEIGQWTKEHLELETKPFGVLRIPTSQVKSVRWTGGGKSVKTDEELDILQVRTAAGSLQSLRGKVLGIRDGALGFRFQGENRRVKMTSLVRADLVREPPVVHETALAVDWWPLSGIVVTAVRRAPNSPTVLTTSWGQALTGRFTGATFRVRNGRAVLLSSLAPIKANHTPYFDVPFPFVRQAPESGWRLRGKTFSQGLLLHSRTTLTYELGQKYDGFHATVGIDDRVGNLGSADVKVLVNGEAVVRWTAVGGGPAKSLEVPLSGASTLTLVVDFGEDQDVGDRVVWGNARLLRAVTKND